MLLELEGEEFVKNLLDSFLIGDDEVLFIKAYREINFLIFLVAHPR
jgi:hypothetical protein